MHRAVFLTLSFAFLAGESLFAQGTADIQREADYILKCQFLNSSDRAHGVINNVFGTPTCS